MLYSLETGFWFLKNPYNLLTLKQGEKPGKTMGFEKPFRPMVFLIKLNLSGETAKPPISASGEIARCPFTLKPTITANTE
jgi:hypothetical protein